MNIGILGGTFNPPHIGHLIVAESVRDQLALERVLFIPCAVPPHKGRLDIVEAHHRIQMVEHAILGNRHFECSDIEIQRGGVSYTVDTLSAIRNMRPSDSLFLLVGMDAVKDFSSWRQPDKIMELATVVSMARPGFSKEDAPQEARDRIIHCEVPRIDISSRKIREHVTNHRSIRYLVPSAVEAYIVRHRLYQ